MTGCRRYYVAALLCCAAIAGCGERPNVAVAANATPAKLSPALEQKLAVATAGIDAKMPGNFGVYIKKLGKDGGIFEREAQRHWYLSSTIKVPLAIAVMEQVDQGKLDLNEKLTLQTTDFVDGSGDLIWQKPGGQYTLAQLIEKSLQDSDSTATDMLMRRIGEPHLNQRIQAWTGGGFGKITTILQVRYDAYGALHPGVAKLSNTQIVSLRNAQAGEPRLQALADALGVSRSSLDATSLEAVFEKYYDRGDNAAALDAFGAMLEKLVTGELLSDASTQRLLNHMRKISTGDRRIAAGLPEGSDFAQKTGTQVARACNVGMVNATAGSDGAVIIVACAEKFEALSQAETAFQQLGATLANVGLVESR